MSLGATRNILFKGAVVSAGVALIAGLGISSASANAEASSASYRIPGAVDNQADILRDRISTKSSGNASDFINNPDLGALSAAAINTLSYADYGFTVSAMTSETYDRETLPWVQVDYKMGVRNIGTNYPRVSISRTASSYGEVVPEVWPYTTMDWGSVAIGGGYGTKGSTLGWKSLSKPSAVKPVTQKLYDSLGNPSVIYGPAQAVSNASPLVTPYSVLEARAWSDDSGVTPWGIVLKTLRMHGREVDTVSKRISGADTIYTASFTDPYGMALRRTLEAIVRDGMVIDATVEVYFYGLMGDPNSTVIQTSRVSQFGNTSPLPVEFNEATSFSGVDFAVAASTQAVKLIGTRAAGLVLNAIPKPDRKNGITQASIVAAAKRLADRDARWFRPPNSMVNDYASKVNAKVPSTSVRISATGNVGFGVVECSIPLVPKGKRVGTGEVSCLPASLPSNN